MHAHKKLFVSMCMLLSAPGLMSMETKRKLSERESLPTARVETQQSAAEHGTGAGATTHNNDPLNSTLLQTLPAPLQRKILTEFYPSYPVLHALNRYTIHSSELTFFTQNISWVSPDTLYAIKADKKVFFIAYATLPHIHMMYPLMSFPYKERMPLKVAINKNNSRMLLVFQHIKCLSSAGRFMPLKPHIIELWDISKKSTPCLLARQNDFMPKEIIRSIHFEGDDQLVVSSLFEHKMRQQKIMLHPETFFENAQYKKSDYSFGERRKAVTSDGLHEARIDVTTQTIVLTDVKENKTRVIKLADALPDSQEKLEESWIQFSPTGTYFMTCLQRAYAQKKSEGAS